MHHGVTSFCAPLFMQPMLSSGPRQGCPGMQTKGRAPGRLWGEYNQVQSSYLGIVHIG